MPGCFPVVVTVAVAGLVLIWLVNGLTGRPITEWLAIAFTGAAIAWFYILIFVVPVIGIIALIVGNYLDF